MVTATTFVGAVNPVRPAYRVRLNNRIFVILAAVPMLLMAVALIVLVLMVPAPAPLSRLPDYTLVRSAVLDRLNGQTLDQMIEIQRGVVAPASSVRGLALNGVTYYYYVEGQASFDPLSRKLVAPSQAQIVLRDSNGPAPLVIYKLIQ